MRTTTLGRSGLTVTPLGLGLAALGRPGYLNLGHAEDLGNDRSVEALRDHAFAMLDAAYAAGVRYFDAARSYGRAEEFLAGWLDARGLAGADVTVGSKWGYTYTAGWRAETDVHEVKDHSLATLTRQHAESVALLGDRLGLYQIHSATLDSGVLEDRAVLSRLGDLADAGLAVGLSVSGERQGDAIRAALAVEIDGVNPFSVVQATWNLLERSSAGALGAASDAGWGVIVKEAVANGRLTPRNADPAFADQATALDRVAGRVGLSRDGLALAAAMAQPWASVTLSGAATPRQLVSNLTATGADVTGDDLAELDGLAEPPEQYWATRSGLRWT